MNPDSVRRIPVGTSPNAMTVLVTKAQWTALINLVARTQPSQGLCNVGIVFPERNNWANGQRRCIWKLRESGLFYWPNPDSSWMMLRPHVRDYIDRNRYAINV